VDREEFGSRVHSIARWASLAIGEWKTRSQAIKVGGAVVRSLTAVVSDLLGHELVDSDTDTPLDDLDLDSLDFIELRCIIEDTIGHEVDEQVFSSFVTIGDLIAFANAEANVGVVVS
jgi:acyl carrier protein